VCWESRLSRSSCPASLLERGIGVDVMVEVIEDAILIVDYIQESWEIRSQEVRIYKYCR
jgi:hypothetical protein